MWVAHSMRDFPSSPCVIRRMPIICVSVVNISMSNDYLRFWVREMSK
jgi:hypothetical protein